MSDEFAVPDDASGLEGRVSALDSALSILRRIQMRAERLAELRRVLADLGLSVGPSTLPPPAEFARPRQTVMQVHRAGEEADPEMAALLGLIHAILDTYSGQAGAGVAAAYADMLRNLSGPLSTAEREQLWWRCLHNRAMLFYALAEVPAPSDLAAPSEEVAAAERLVSAAGLLAHGATTVRLMMELPPDALPGGSGERREVLETGMRLVLAGHQDLDASCNALIRLLSIDAG